MRRFVPEAMCDFGSGTLVPQRSSGTNILPNSGVTQVVWLSPETLVCGVLLLRTASAHRHDEFAAEQSTGQEIV